MKLSGCTIAAHVLNAVFRPFRIECVFDVGEPVQEGLDAIIDFIESRAHVRQALVGSSARRSPVGVVVAVEKAIVMQRGGGCGVAAGPRCRGAVPMGRRLPRQVRLGQHGRRCAGQRVRPPGGVAPPVDAHQERFAGVRRRH